MVNGWSVEEERRGVGVSKHCLQTFDRSGARRG